ncbi:MAG: radical SAM protein [Polyangiaceae bacterium]
MSLPRPYLQASSLVERWLGEFSPSTLHGYHVIDWDVDHGLSLTLGCGDDHVLIELSARDEGSSCLTRTERFNVTARARFATDPNLSQTQLIVVDAVLHALRRMETTFPPIDRPTVDTAHSRKLSLRAVGVDRALTREGLGQYYLNPYVGCSIGCSYCFVEHQADLARALEGEPWRPWGRWVDIKRNLPAVLAREVRELTPGIVRMSPIVTDPYQPIEGRERITRQCLKLMLPAGFSPCVLTRAARLAEDIPLLTRFEKAWVGVSIPTDDDEVRRAFEPLADPIAARLDLLQKCKRAGLRTFAVIQPILPHDTNRLVDALAPLIEVVRIDGLHLGNRVRSIYEQLGRTDAMSDGWFQERSAALADAFRAQGVRLHELEDLRDLFEQRRC